MRPNDAAARFATVLVRVHQVRVRRCLAALAQKQRVVNSARSGLAGQQAARDAHAARLKRVLALCGYDHPEAALWRYALNEHRRQDGDLCAAIHQAEQTLSAALDELSVASADLQREMRARDDAVSRERTARARARRDD